MPELSVEYYHGGWALVLGDFLYSFLNYENVVFQIFFMIHKKTFPFTALNQFSVIASQPPPQLHIHFVIFTHLSPNPCSARLSLLNSQFEKMKQVGGFILDIQTSYSILF